MINWVRFRWWVIRWWLICKRRYGWIPWPGLETLREYFDDNESPLDAVLSDESYWEPDAPNVPEGQENE